MKKYFVLFMFIVFISACSNVKEKESENEQENLYTLQTELKKDFSAIKVVNADTSSAVDAFGNPLQENAWYALSNKTNVLFPIDWQYGSLLFTFERWRNNYRNHEMKIVRTRIFAIKTIGSKANIEVDFLLLGNKELFLYPEMHASNPYASISANIKDIED